MEMLANVITSHFKFQLRMFPIHEASKIGLVSLFFPSFCQGVMKHKYIIRKFGTLKGRIKAHSDTKFGYSTINGHKVINNFL